MRCITVFAAVLLASCDREHPTPVATPLAATGPSASSEPQPAQRLEPALCEEIARLGEWRYSPMMVRLADDRVLVIGGRHDDFASWLSEVEIIDIKARTVTPVAPMHEGRSAIGAAIALQDGRVLVVGGLEKRSVELYDAATNHWSTATPIDAVVGGILDRLPSGHVLITGGIDMGHHGITSRASLVWDPRAGAKKVGDLPIGETDMETMRAVDGRLIVAANMPGTDAGGSPDYRIFDEARATFVAYGGPAPRPVLADVASLGESDTQVLSGWKTGEPILVAGPASIVRFDGSRREWKTVAVFRAKHQAGGAMLLDARHAVVLGGLDKDSAGIEVCTLP